MSDDPFASQLYFCFMWLRNSNLFCRSLHCDFCPHYLTSLITWSGIGKIVKLCTFLIFPMRTSNTLYILCMLPVGPQYTPVNVHASKVLVTSGSSWASTYLPKVAWACLSQDSHLCDMSSLGKYQCKMPPGTGNALSQRQVQ